MTEFTKGDRVQLLRYNQHLTPQPPLSGGTIKAVHADSTALVAVDGETDVSVQLADLRHLLPAASREGLAVTWPDLSFTAQGLARYAEVLKFLRELEAEKHEFAAEIVQCFIERLDYLNGYGGSLSDEDPRPRFRVELGHDWAPLSFSLSWLRYDPKAPDSYAYAWCGGLTWHGGGNDPLTISLTPQWFGIHT